MSAVLGVILWSLGAVVALAMMQSHLEVSVLPVLFCMLTNFYGFYNLLGRGGSE